MPLFGICQRMNSNQLDFDQGAIITCRESHLRSKSCRFGWQVFGFNEIGVDSAEKGHSLQSQLEGIQKHRGIQRVNSVVHFKEDFSTKTFYRPESKK